MNCYTAHLFKAKKKIYILFSRTSLFLFFIHFIKSGHSFTLILTLSRSSLIPLKLHSLNIAAIVKFTPVRYNLLLLFSFSFFHFIKSGLIYSHSLSLIHCHLSSQASQAHSLNVAGPVSLSQLRSPTHKARRRSECLTRKPMELAADWSACLWILVLSHRRSQIWVFFPVVDW